MAPPFYRLFRRTCHCLLPSCCPVHCSSWIRASNRRLCVAVVCFMLSNVIILSFNMYGRVAVEMEQADVIFDDLCSSNEKPPRRPLPIETRTRGDWQIYAGNELADAELVTYAAYYDDRPVLGGKTYIRTLAIASYPADNSTFYCQVWYQRHPFPFVVAAEALRVGRDYRINNATYRQLLLSCELPQSTGAAQHATVAGLVPTHVSMTAMSPCLQSSILLPVIHPPGGDVWRSTTTHETDRRLPLGVCVAISFGSLPLEELVEWFELNRMLGIGEFNIYNGSMSPALDGVLNYYARDAGVVNVHQMGPPVVDRKAGVTMDTIKVSSPASLNDCMVRNMYRYRFVVAIDFDEVIVPRRHDNYSAMLDDIERTLADDRGLVTTEASVRWGQHHTYAFRNAYFFREYGRRSHGGDGSSAAPTTRAAASRGGSTTPTAERKSEPVPSDKTADAVNLVTSDYRLRAPINDVGFAPKSFVNPRRCLSLFNHYCYIRFRRDALGGGDGTPIGKEGVTGGSWRAKFLDVPTDFGISHHYRKNCNVGSNKCQSFKAGRQLDESTTRFSEQLRQRVERVLREIAER